MVVSLAALAFALTISFADISVAGAGRPVDPRALDDLVKLELGGTAPLDDVAVRLEGDRADVTVTRAGKKRSGSVSLPAKNAERALALFIGELARRFETEPEPEPPPAEEPTPAPVATAPPPSTPVASNKPDPLTTQRPTKTPFFALATMGARLFASEWSPMATPRIEGGLVANAVRFGVLARYGYARATDTIGDATVHAVGGGLALTFLGDIIASGPRLELGALFASGDGSRASSKTSIAPAFSWEIEAHVQPADWLGLLVSFEAGWMWNGLDVRADDRTLLQIGGPFVGGSLGFAIPSGIHYDKSY